MNIQKYFKSQDSNSEPMPSESISTSNKNDGTNQASSSRAVFQTYCTKKESLLHKKRRKRWNAINISFGFFGPLHETSNSFPLAKCLFYVIYSNANVVPSKLSCQLKTKHSEHQP